MRCKELLMQELVERIQLISSLDVTTEPEAKISADALNVLFK